MNKSDFENYIVLRKEFKEHCKSIVSGNEDAFEHFYECVDEMTIVPNNDKTISFYGTDEDGLEYSVTTTWDGSEVIDKTW